MKLERARELYSDYVEGSLTPAMRLALEQHLESGAEARADFDQFTKVFALLNDPAPQEMEAPLGFRAKIMQLAEAEQAKRPTTPQDRIADMVRGWFGRVPRQQFAAGVFTLAAVAVVAGMWLHPVSGPPQGGLVPTITLASPVSTTIQGVTPAIKNGNLFYNFRIHLPSSVKSAGVNAYIITATDQILDPAIREQEATPVLKTAQSLTNDEQMQIPVGLTQQAPPDSTLTMFVQWTPDDGSAQRAQVVFTPLNQNSGSSARVVPETDGNFYDTLESVAAAYHVTVIAAADSSPTNKVSSWTQGDDVLTALQTVAKSSGYDVRTVPDSPETYQVYRKSGGFSGS